MKQKTDDVRAGYADRVYSYLREQIINGNLRPGEKLVESRIAEQLGLSRGPVRDALKHLALEGLVDYQTNRGCSVALLSPKDAYEVFFMRGSLEKLALEKSGCHIDDCGILIMESALEDMRIASESGNMLDEVSADEKFHRQIVLSCQINRLYKMWEMLSPLNGAMFLTLKNAKYSAKAEAMGYVSPRLVVPPHREILEIIKTGDLAASCKALDAHYIKNGELVYRMSLIE